MLNLLLTGSIAFIITFFAIPAIIKIAEAKRLFDIPDARKIHKKPIASLGGVGIFTGFFLADLLFISSHQYPEFQYFFAAAIVIFFLGLKDDILIITATKKFVGQISAAAIIIHLGGLQIDSMHGLFGVHQLPQAFSLALSYLTIILIINAYNLIDGVDGLAGMLGLLTMSVFGIYFYIAGMEAYSLLAFSLGGSLLAFLIFNHHPAKIFMGDSGSLMVGLFNAILVLKFISVAETPAVPVPVESVVPVGISILMIPLLDTIRVFSIRIFSGRSPFSPDRNHIHHLLLDKGLSHKHVALACLLLNTFFISLAYFGRGLGPTVLTCTLITVAFGFLGVLIYYKKPFISRTVPLPAHRSSIATSAHAMPVASKVVAINSEKASAVSVAE